MPARMFRDDFKARPNSEPEHWNEGIPITNPVHIIVARLFDQDSGSFGAPKETIQNTGIYLSDRRYFSRRSGASTSRIGSNERTDKPTAEPAKNYLVDWLMLPSFHGSTENRHEDFISDAQVLQALADAPGARIGLPVQLGRTQSSCNDFRTPVGAIQFRDEPR